MSISITDFDADAVEFLQSRAQVNCVTFGSHRMPACTVPALARVGVGPAGTGVALYVGRGLAYTGDVPEVSDWFTHGVKYFPDFPATLTWLNSVVPAVPREPAPIVAPRRPEVAQPASVTNLADVVAAALVPSGVSEVDLRDELLASISGQDAAVSVLAAGVARHTHKKFARGPYSAMLLGHTGTGKTATAIKLADALTDLASASWKFIRLDMAEYSESISVARLVGTAPGYIGYRDGNDLATFLAANPHAVVLFDEIEKAHPTVVKTLLGLLDTGRLGRAFAPTAVILATSNLGVEELAGVVGGESARTHLRRQGLAPELVARLNDVVVFEELAGSVLAEIVVRSIGLIAADYGISIAWIAPTYISDLLARLGDNRLGVRVVEYLVDADLGEQLSIFDGTFARIVFDVIPTLVNVDLVEGSLDTAATS